MFQWKYSPHSIQYVRFQYNIFCFSTLNGVPQPLVCMVYMLYVFLMKHNFWSVSSWNRTIPPHKNSPHKEEYIFYFGFLKTRKYYLGILSWCGSLTGCSEFCYCYCIKIYYKLLYFAVLKSTVFSAIQTDGSNLTSNENLFMCFVTCCLPFLRCNLYLLFPPPHVSNFIFGFIDSAPELLCLMTQSKLLCAHWVAFIQCQLHASHTYTNLKCSWCTILNFCCSNAELFETCVLLTYTVCDVWSVALKQ